MNIAFLGNFAKEKGSEIFKDIVLKSFKTNSFHKFYIFGYIGDINSYEKIENKILAHQSFSYGSLPYLLKKYKIDLGITPSLFPETFCKVFFESINYCDIIIPYYIFPAFVVPNYPFIVKFKNKKEFVSKSLELIDKKMNYKEKYFGNVFLEKINNFKINNERVLNQIISPLP